MFDLSSFFFVMSQQPFVLPYIPFVAVLDISFGLCMYLVVMQDLGSFVKLEERCLHSRE